MDDTTPKVDQGVSVDLGEFERTPDQGQKGENEATTADTTQKKTDEQPADAASEDRSAFNCSACNGQGLKSETELCPECGGTGKVG